MNFGTMSFDDLVAKTVPYRYTDNGVVDQWKIPGYPVGVVALYGDDPMISTGNPAEGPLSGYWLPDPENAGYGLTLMRAPDGSIAQDSRMMQRDWADKYLGPLVAAGVLAVFAVAAVAVASGAAAGAGAGAETAAGGGWVSAEGGAGYIGGAAADAGELTGVAAGGLDVSNLGLNEFTDGLPDISQMTVGADGSLGYSTGSALSNLSASDLTNWAKTLKTAGGLVGTLAGAGAVRNSAGQGLPASTLMVRPQQLATAGVVAPSGGNKMVWIAGAAVVAAALMMMKRKKS